MSMRITNHTPLPWTRKSKGRYLIGKRDVDGKEVLVADLYSDTHLPFGLPDRSEYRSNGALILKGLEAFELLKTYARMFKAGEYRDLGDGCPAEEYHPGGNDSEVDAFYALISDARQITGELPDTLVEDGGRE